MDNGRWFSRTWLWNIYIINNVNMSATDTIITILVLLLLFLLGYAAIQRKKLIDIFQEIKDMAAGGKTVLVDKVNLKYA